MAVCYGLEVADECVRFKDAASLLQCDVWRIIIVWVFNADMFPSYAWEESN